MNKNGKWMGHFQNFSWRSRSYGTYFLFSQWRQPHSVTNKSNLLISLFQWPASPCSPGMGLNVAICSRTISHYKYLLTGMNTQMMLSPGCRFRVLSLFVEIELKLNAPSSSCTTECVCACYTSIFNDSQTQIIFLYTDLQCV